MCPHRQQLATFRSFNAIQCTYRLPEYCSVDKSVVPIYLLYTVFVLIFTLRKEEYLS